MKNSMKTLDNSFLAVGLNPSRKMVWSQKVICKVCFKIRGKSIVLCVKNNTLWKDQGSKIAKNLGHGVDVGEKYVDCKPIDTIVA